MEISPVPFDQIVQGRDGRRYTVDGWAGQIAADLRAVDDTLHVEFNEGGMFFTVIQRIDVDGELKESLVARVPMGEWDQRIVEDIRMRNHELRHGLNPADRLDRLDAQRKAEQDHAFDELVGERAAKLFHSFERDLGAKPRIFVPERKRPASAVA